MDTITTEQIKKIHAILPAKIKASTEAKAELVSKFTEDETKTSTKDLSKWQAEELIHFLKTGKVKDYAYYANFDVKNKQHKYILSLCHQINWVVFSVNYQRLVPDLKRLGAWLHKYGYLHKPLMEYCAHDLPKLVTQFERLVKTNIEK